MQVHITEGEIAGTRFNEFPNIQTYIKALKVIEYWRRNTKESNILARKEAEELIALSPENSLIYTLLGYVYVQA